MSIFDKARELLSRLKPLTNQAASYFNPTSNAGDNFWSTQAAQRLGNTQKAIQQVFPTIASRYKKTPELNLQNVQSAIKNTPVLPFVQQTTLPNLARIPYVSGRKLQEVNLPSINLPDRSFVPGGNSFANILKASFPALQTEQINSLVQGYGRTLANPSENPVETALNVLPFMGSLKSVRSIIKPTAVKSFIEQGATKTPLGGLLSETLGQTTFRREAGLKVGDVYRKTEEIVNQMIDPKGLIRNLQPIKKVNIIDYLRTPDRVLQKIGLGQEAEGLRNAWDAYKLQLPKEIDKINQWYRQASSPEASQRIFDYLDGTLKKEALASNELKVAGEIKTYLRGWADKLGLPEEKRITNYVTHIFNKGDIELEFDPEVAKMIEGKVPGSVYDPFLKARTNAPEFVHDVWRALDAYTKRALRKVNMDPALELVEKASNKLDLESYKYVQRLTGGVNLRPTEVDNLIDNFVKATPVGYKFTNRPTAYLTQGVRQWVYRGALGLNVGSAVRNLTQSINTYSKLGERWTVSGAFNFIRKVASGNLDELKEVGVLNDNFIGDRTLTATKRLTERADKGLFFFFDWAEKINRGIAYYGAKAKYLAEGLDEAQAIKRAKDLVRATQFTFGAVDTPVILQSDIAKLLLQFQSFNLKQAEFLGEMVKNKEFAGLFRYAVSSLALVGILGKSLGYEIKDFIPFSGVLTGETKLGQTPPVQLVKGLTSSAVGAPNEYGQVPEGNILERLSQNKDVTGALTAFIPGGVQMKKTIEGLKAFKEGASYTKTGRTRFEVAPTAGNFIKSALFGQYYTNEGRQYVENLGKSKSQILYEELKQLSPEQAAARVKQLKTSNPSAYRSFTDYMNDQALKITGEEKNLRSLTVKDGERVKSLVKLFNAKKTAQEKADLYKRLKELGVITAEIEAQLNAARKAGVLR